MRIETLPAKPTIVQGIRGYVMNLETIQDSFINGQNGQAVSQIKRYGVSKFWFDFAEHLDEAYPEEGAWYHYKNALRVYRRINHSDR